MFKASMIGCHLLPMATRNAKFCAEILPWIIHDILKTVPTCGSLSHSIVEFFGLFYKTKKSIKVSKSQKYFFLILHCPKRDRKFKKDFCPSL